MESTLVLGRDHSSNKTSLRREFCKYLNVQLFPIGLDML